MPPSDAAVDPYEGILLRPPALPDVLSREPGLLVAQSMLLGGLDTPGQGQSGGLSVFLGALGDGLVDADGIAGVLTVVTAGYSEEAIRDAHLLSARRPGGPGDARPRP
ncbi:glycosyltransferase family 4 protein, partial [Streptomyces sp. NPDC005047]